MSTATEKTALSYGFEKGKSKLSFRHVCSKYVVCTIAPSFFFIMDAALPDQADRSLETVDSPSPAM